MRGDGDMKGRIARKLKSRAGESIAETLIGMLIASLALVMLAGSISTATRLILTSKDRMDEYYAADGDMAKQTGEAATIEITLEGGGVEQIIDGVDCYGNDKFENMPVYSYVKKTTGEGG